ncbi:IclR family transcriptional regulator [Paralimibaculum aggregatum]|uniref:IclR family transcriptional regulator n=1 Tax=Paralimibaculum aggregatum TaxID=3036245 RepID=A0ABQ6LSS4_9RHOB|nr:HTH-type transcriptional regulator BhcR [Limibaculum sp. NKW23]GMG85123.1 IclR family transcriptional regulator [Limibaculum sp. NKW23]
MEQQSPKRPRGRPRGPGAEAGRGTVQALDRGLRLLQLLAREQRIALSDIALQAGMPTATAHRLLMTLAARGFAAFDETSQDWMIGIEAFRAGAGFLHRVSLVEASRGILHGLVGETGETANLAIVDGDEVVFVNQVETQHPIRAFFRPGSRSRMHASGAGKALLAEFSRGRLERLLRQKGLERFTPRTLTRPERLHADLAAIRARGWALDDEEHVEGMRCIAAAVFNLHGEAVAALSVSGPASRFPEPRIAETGAAVRRAARALTEATGGHCPEAG